MAGEGGIVATHDEELARTLRLGRDYGNPGDYDCRFPGLNARMSELHAAVALPRCPCSTSALVHRRGLVAAVLGRASPASRAARPDVAAADVSTYKDLTLIVDAGRRRPRRPAMTAALAAEGIDSPPLLRPADPPAAGVRRHTGPRRPAA